MIRKGEPWGDPVVLTGDEPVAPGDPELARLLHGGDAGVIVLRGGDLHHSLGGRPGLPTSPPGTELTALPIDLLRVVVEGHEWFGVAHVVARRRWWSGEFAVAMNATHLGEWNLGPKAHPNDGLVDVTRGRLDLRDRLAARRRAHTGTHVPHPALATSRVGSVDWRFERPLPIRVDGVVVARSQDVHVEVRPDAGVVVVG